jgi:hypothetical protein
MIDVTEQRHDIMHCQSSRQAIGGRLPQSSGEHCTPVAGGCQHTTFSPMFRKRYGTIDGNPPMVAEHPGPVAPEHVGKRAMMARNDVGM